MLPLHILFRSAFFVDMHSLQKKNTPKPIMQFVQGAHTMGHLMKYYNRQSLSKFCWPFTIGIANNSELYYRKCYVYQFIFSAQYYFECYGLSQYKWWMVMTFDKMNYRKTKLKAWPAKNVVCKERMANKERKSEREKKNVHEVPYIYSKPHLLLYSIAILSTNNPFNRKPTQRNSWNAWVLHMYHCYTHAYINQSLK